MSSVKGVGPEDRMDNGSFPIKTQVQADHAWYLRGHSKEYSEEQVVAHIRAQVKKHGLKMPGPIPKREAAAFSGPHGMVWPDGMPDCAVCDRPANDPVHVNPPKMTPGMQFRINAADKSTNPHLPVRAHAYSPSAAMITQRVMCAACGDPLSSSAHRTGMPSGRMSGGSPFGVQAAREVAFVAQIGHKLVLAAPAFVGTDISELPRQLSQTFERVQRTSPHNLWVAGRYVEADRPNRNSAFWSTEDLEIGAPTVTHGPLNWHHQEKDIVGAIVDSELVRQDRQAAADGIGNHIAALAVVWPYIHRERAMAIQRASDHGKLWFSMECVSREVACLAPDCGTQMSYGDYMRQQDQRCQHMRQGAPRRFIAPIFDGGAVIVPPVRPGWANADARVLKQAAAMAERQAAAFGDLTTSEAELLVASLLQNGEQS